jgi:predicted nucleotidyltransferase
VRSDSNRERFTRALDEVLAQVRHDRSILAAVLCGSLSHDTVWAKSDIDLLFVTVDDRKVEPSHLALYADGVNLHALLVPRTEFRRTVEGAVRNSFMHAFLAKGRLLYTHDPTIADLCATLEDMGERDRHVQLLRAATAALPPLYKAHKWFLTRGDLDYTALWLLYAATPLARIEVIDAGLIADREVIPQAMRLNPALFRVVYIGLLNEPKTPERIRAALDTVDTYLAERATILFKPVLEYLRDAGDTRSCSEIEAWFTRHYDVGEVITACEYLADRGLIGKASTPVRLTKKSSVDVQELAFFYVEPKTF